MVQPESRFNDPSPYYDAKCALIEARRYKAEGKDYVRFECENTPNRFPYPVIYQVEPRIPAAVSSVSRFRQVEGHYRVPPPHSPPRIQKLENSVRVHPIRAARI